MEPIRILHVVGKMHRAGLETFIMNIYRNIDREKIQFDFLTHYTEEGDYDAEIESLGGRIYRLSVMEDKNFISYFKHLDDFFKSHKEYQIIHGHWATFGVFYMYFAKRNGIKYRIAHAHNDRMPPGIRGATVNTLIKPMKYVSNYYLACSVPAINWLYGKKSNIVKNKQVKVIKNAIELDKFKFNQDFRNKYREQLNIENKFVIGHIGRFTYQKNQEFIIEVFKRVYDKDNNSFLLLIGTGEDKEKIKDKVERMGLKNSVLFLGSRSDIPELLSVMDLFLFPSNYEALGIVAIEAQATGLPTVVSTAIPEETYVTKFITSLSLESPLDQWTEEIYRVKNLPRTDTHEEIRLSGYDIKEEVKNLQNFYLNLK